MKQQLFLLALITLLTSCGKPPSKQYYLLNYQAEALQDRYSPEPYPFTLRVKPFEIEKAYSKPNIVFRKNPYELEYYGFRHWAVRPKDMMTDLIFSHITKINLVDGLVRRLDEGSRPDYELSGNIEAIEEYDSEEYWFAHLAVRFQVKRLSDEKIIYNRAFGQRKRVEERDPAIVVRALSEITDYTASELMTDLDSLFYRELTIIAGADSEGE